MNKQIEALLQERAGYIRRNLPKRVEAVDAALRELGFEHKYMTPEPSIETTTAEPGVERATMPKTRRRKNG